MWKIKKKSGFVVLFFVCAYVCLVHCLRGMYVCVWLNCPFFFDFPNSTIKHYKKEDTYMRGNLTEDIANDFRCERTSNTKKFYLGYCEKCLELIFLPIFQTTERRIDTTLPHSIAHSNTLSLTLTLTQTHTSHLSYTHSTIKLHTRICQKKFPFTCHTLIELLASFKSEIFSYTLVEWDEE